MRHRMWRHRAALVVLALGYLGTTDARAQGAADRLEGPIPEEVLAYREAAVRFHERATEVSQDTQAYVSFREDEERGEISAQYDLRLEPLGEDEKSRRDAAVKRFEEFLSRYPETEYTSSVRFRLAELYYDQANERYLADGASYFAAQESDDLEVLEKLADMEPPQLDLAKSIEQYQRIIDDNLGKPKVDRWEDLDGAFVGLGFCYSVEDSKQRDEVRAREIYRQLIKEVPESELADRSYLALGKTAFNQSKYDEAIAEYEQVLAKGPEGKFYDTAQYQIAWAKFKLNAYDEALALFSSLLDDSEVSKTNTGRESDFAPDARRFIAHSIADVANNEFRDAVVVAREYFERTGHKPYEHEVYVQLADILLRYSRSNEAIQVLEYLQEGPGGEWKYHPRNPEHQNQVVVLFSSGLSRDLVRAGEERIHMTATYGDQSEWARQNRNDPDALASAREFIETGLLYVAQEYFSRGDETQDVAAYAMAAQKYREYLDAFPIADDYYNSQWFLAQAYKKTKDFPASSAEFEKLFRSRRYHPYGDAALYELMNARLQITQQASGPRDKACQDCRSFDGGAWTGDGTGAVWAVERTYQAKGDKPVDIPVYVLPQDRLDFVEAADVLVDHTWTDVDPRLLPPNFPEYKPAFDKQRHQFLYITGQMLFYANRFDEARARFERVIAEYPRTNEASFSARLLVDSYLAEGDLEKVRVATRRFTSMLLGPTEIPSADFQNLLEETSFELSNDLARKGDFVGGAEAFLAFIKEFPQSKNAPLALYNAAYYYTEAGQKERANEIYMQFVDKYPTHEFSEKTYSLIAQNFEATFQLESAIDYWDRLHTRFPNSDSAPDALWEASFLRVGLGRYSEAAKGYEEYARRFPDREDREATHWRAGEQYEQVGDEQALAFYKRYLDQYGIKNPDHAIEAEYRIAKIFERKGDTRAYDKQLDKIIATYEKIRASGAAVGPAGVEYAAAAEFRYLNAAFLDFTDEELTQDEEKDDKLLTVDKPAEIKEFEAKVDAYIGKYPGTFEWISAAFYLQGMATLDFADLGLSFKCPKGLGEEDCWAFEDALDQYVFPKYRDVEKFGVQRLNDLVKVASDQKKHSPFIDKALIELNKRDPLTYPAVKDQLRGGARAGNPTPLTPRTSTGEVYASPTPAMASPLTTPGGESSGTPGSTPTSPAPAQTEQP